MCSEFGNWGLPDPDALRDATGDEPWWFETGHDWGEGVMYAHGVENRFADWSLDRVFGNLRGFVEAAQWQQFRALKYEIETMRRRPELAGYVITEMHRRAIGSPTACSTCAATRACSTSVFHAINADTVIVPRWDRLSLLGRRNRADRACARARRGPRRSRARHWRCSSADEAKRLDLPRIEAGGVLDLGGVELRAPDVADAACVSRYALNCVRQTGTVLATNRLDVGGFIRP